MEGIKRINLGKVGKVYVITDTHLGLKNGSNEWLDRMMDYFYKDFIPKVKESIGPNDILIHSGDVFDNRQSITLNVLSKSIKLFSDLSNIFKSIHIIVGNHDIQKKFNNDITSLDTLIHIPNVNVYKENHILCINEGFENYKEILMLPWNHSYEEQLEDINNSGCNWVFSHTNYIGLSFDNIRTVQSGEGINTNLIDGPERIFNGHIHHRSTFGIVNNLGTPYQMSRSDIMNNKGFWVLKPLNRGLEEEFIENEVSPKFGYLYLKHILEYSVKDLEQSISNTILDLRVPVGVNWRISALKNLLDPIVYKLNIIPYRENVAVSEGYKNDNNDTDIVSHLETYLSKEYTNEKFKERVKNKFTELYKKYK